MRRSGVALSIFAAIALLAGCGDVLERLALQPHTSTSVETPDPPLSYDAVVAMARPSVVKVRAEAPSCRKILEGTGFVVAPHKVLTNAHVVAGGQSVTVNADGTTLDARVVSYDPTADIAIIDVPELSAQPLNLATSPVTAGTEVLVLSYPNAESFAAMAARVRKITRLKGPNIYRTAETNRQVYIIDTVDGRLLQGVSGSPLIGMNGRVLGVVYGAEVGHTETGFALTSIEISSQMAAIGNTQSVGTEACVG